MSTEQTFTLCIQPNSSYSDGSYVYVVTAPDYEAAERLVAEDLLPVAQQNLRDDGDVETEVIDALTAEGVFGNDGGDSVFDIVFVFNGNCETTPLKHQLHHTGGWVDDRIFLSHDGNVPLRTYYATITADGEPTKRYAIRAVDDDDAYKVTGHIRDARHGADGKWWETSYFSTETPADLADGWVHLRYDADGRVPYVRLNADGTVQA